METRTMENFADMATRMIECLNFTWDSPSNNPSGAMLVLDTQMWVGLPSREWGVPKEILDEGTQLPIKSDVLKPIVLYKFYRKSISNPTPMNSRTAAPKKQQVQTATQEFIRRLKLTSRRLPTHHIEEILAEYSCDLKRGGYTSAWVKESMKSALIGYSRMVRNELQGICPVNRPESATRKK